MLNWHVWLRGLISAAVSGFATTITVMIVDPNTFNLDTGIKQVLTVAVVSAIVSVANYLKKSPLPEKEQK